MEKDWLVLLGQQDQVAKVLETNEASARFGLVLTQEEAKLIAAEGRKILRQQRRVEFGEGIISKIIYEFCDSQYIQQDGYVDVLIRLQEIFYLYKNEMEDRLTDDELLHLMKEQFEILCFGDLDYLEDTCLANFAQAVRAGYRGFRGSDGYGEYARFDETDRWDHELYLETLKELCWR